MKRREFIALLGVALPHGRSLHVGRRKVARTKSVTCTL